MSKKPASRRRKAKNVQAMPTPIVEAQPDQALVPYDENLLERARIQWQFGDWDSLTKIDRGALQHHPDRAKLALLAAAGSLQTNNSGVAREFIRLAQDWGCSKKLLTQILVAGVHNSLGRAAAVVGRQSGAVKHFESAIAVGTPGAEFGLLVEARTRAQFAQLGLPGRTPLAPVGTGDAVVPSASTVPAAARGIEEIVCILRQQQLDLDAKLKKQADEFICVRKFLEASLKREVANAAKQIEAVVGLQGYFATGELPNINTERHSWPISPDFALRLVEILETNDYDLIIEFGSGISTVIMAKVVAKMAVRRRGKPPVELVSFDHLERFYAQTLAHLKQAGLAESVQLHLAPLVDYTAANGRAYYYYDCNEALLILADRHSATGLRMLVVIDGPPAATGKHARYPAGPLILDHFKGAKIDLLLDDYIRDDEKEIAKLWEDEFAAANLSYTTTECKLEKDAFLIAIAANLSTTTA
ncbi:MAG: methyltransferase FkbM [Candidatus Accumulibacter delftensis]